jgi:hypothetical protein
MSCNLLMLGGFAHDPQRVLAAVQWLTYMNIELLLEDFGGTVQIAKGVHRRFKLFIAALADSQNRNAFGILHGFEFSWHV